MGGLKIKLRSQLKIIFLLVIGIVTNIVIPIPFFGLVYDLFLANMVVFKTYVFFNFILTLIGAFSYLLWIGVEFGLLLAVMLPMGLITEICFYSVFRKVGSRFRQYRLNEVANT